MTPPCEGTAIVDDSVFILLLCIESFLKGRCRFAACGKFVNFVDKSYMKIIEKLYILYIRKLADGVRSCYNRKWSDCIEDAYLIGNKERHMGRPKSKTPSRMITIDRT